jgi:Omp85 superfamily domain
MGTRKPRRRALIAWALVVVLASATGAPAFSLGHGGLPVEWAQKLFGDEITDVSFVPVPEIILDPNEGNTFGVMGAWLLLNDADEVRYMIAPDVRYNDTKGVYPAFRILAYPTNDRFWNVLIAKSSTIDQDYEFEFEDYGLWDGKAFIETEILYEDDSTERFFGIGNNSDEDRESNYTSSNFYLEAMPGIYVLPKVHVSLKTRLQHFDVKHGQVNDFPFVRNEFPGVPGLEPAWYWTNRLALSFDSRDSRDITTEGTFAQAYTEVADRALGSSSSFWRYGIEGRHFIPFRKQRNPILAMRARLDYMDGPRKQTPFWLQSALGGKRSLRGYGSDRFIDMNSSLASVELRTKVWSVDLFGVTATVELAPFIETGQVFASRGDSPVDDLHWVYGLGFRGLVPPTIVAFVDVGAGDEGVSVFSGIDYPF